MSAEMSAVLRPAFVPASRLDRLRATVSVRLEQYREIAMSERIEPRPDWNRVIANEAAADALRAVLLDIEKEDRP